jgi:uncharacterized membrane protein SirB2
MEMTSRASSTTTQVGGAHSTFPIPTLIIIIMQLVSVQLVVGFFETDWTGLTLTHWMLGLWETFLLALGVFLHAVHETDSTEAMTGDWLIITSSAILVYIIFKVASSKGRRRRPRSAFTLDFVSVDLASEALESEAAPHTPPPAPAPAPAPPTYKALYGEETEQPPDYFSDSVRKY